MSSLDLHVYFFIYSYMIFVGIQSKWIEAKYNEVLLDRCKHLKSSAIVWCLNNPNLTLVKCSFYFF